MEVVAGVTLATYDPQCYLCPGNSRSGGQVNPRYESTHVFDNDFPALLPDSPADKETFEDREGLLVSQPERGICRVVCFSPDHSLTLSRMSVDGIEGVVAEWTRQYRDLGAVDWVGSVQVFENRGEMMGASNPHPHGQIWATESVPGESSKEVESQRSFYLRYAEPLLMRYLDRELAAVQRIVCANHSFVALVPFWAVWPFETLILPRRQVTGLDELTTTESRGLAAILGEITQRYDRLFQAPFPYSMGFHQRPTDGAAHSSFTLHGHFYPPLLRSAAIRKFMVGFEMLAGPQRDLTPETAAARLRGE